MRIVGIDFGEKRIGISMSDPLMLTAQPLKVIEKAATYAKDAENIKESLKELDGIGEIVVGLPKTMKNEIGIAAQKVLEFVEELKKAFDMPIITWDERLTTAQAGKMLKDAGLSNKAMRKVIDKTAATFILKNYLDCRKK